MSTDCGLTENEVVAFGVADGVVYPSHAPDEVVTRWRVREYHVGVENQRGMLEVVQMLARSKKVGELFCSLGQRE